jgi:uncharacterized membrane protein
MAVAVAPAIDQNDPITEAHQARNQPPLIPAVAATMHHLFPGSLVMLRLLPALAHAATIQPEYHLVGFFT